MLQVVQLDGILTSEVFEVFDVLMVHLLEDLLEILGLSPLHVGVELSLLILGELLLGNFLTRL